MSLKIKIPRAGPSQVCFVWFCVARCGRGAHGQIQVGPKVSKRRQAAIYSSDDEDGVQAAPSTVKAHKRARTEERSSPEGAGADIDVEADDDVNVEDELPEDTRFLPPDLAVSKTAAKRNAGSSVPRKSRPPARKSKKRAVVLSDEDEGDEAYREDVDVVNDEGDDDFEPEEVSTQKKAAVRLKLKGPKARDDPKTIARDERLLASSTSRASSVKRRLSVDEGDGEYGTPKVVQKEKDATPPIPKKRKLPPIKKNKPTNGTSTNSSTPGATPAPVRPPMKPLVDERDSLALPVAGARKTAAKANNADFDLRDKSVYASLFMKVCRTQ